MDEYIAIAVAVFLVIGVAVMIMKVMSIGRDSKRDNVTMRFLEKCHSRMSGWPGVRIPYDPKYPTISGLICGSIVVHVIHLFAKLWR